MMSSVRSFLCAAVVAVAGVVCAQSEFSLLAGKYAVFQTNAGGFVIKLHTDKAPQTVGNFVALATGKKSWTHPMTQVASSRLFYDNTQFYFCDGDKLRGGDPVNRGTGGPGYSLPIEQSSMTDSASGMVGMELTQETLNGSRFYITLSAKPGEKAPYFGQVLHGMNTVQAIAAKPKAGTRPLDPVTVQSVTIVDVPTGHTASGRLVEEEAVFVAEIDREMKPIATPTPKPTPEVTPTPTPATGKGAKPTPKPTGAKPKATPRPAAQPASQPTATGSKLKFWKTN